tara:strand:+ start:249 stop:443 length:195 start_codon:yes stop_codon:yes gene_type:complete
MSRIAIALSNSGHSDQEVKEIVKDLKETALSLLTEGGSLDEIEEVLLDVGLEPDYVDELIHCII